MKRLQIKSCNYIKLHWVLCLLFTLNIRLIEGSDSKIIMADESIPFSPRLEARTTVTYNNKMYVYGGRYVAVVGHSSDMYVYNFDTPNGETATMSLVKQTNKGPSCAFCGAVMIDESHMMILSHKFANSSVNSTESRTVVRPYIFDFVSLTWTEKEVPTYNQTDESAFYMRARHGTVLGKDGMIYVIGGTNFYEDSKPLTTSYFYDPVLNYYGIIDNNGFDYKTIGPSTFNLPDGNIGSVFGRFGLVGIRDYNLHTAMMILHTKTKTWIRNQTLSTTLLDDIQFVEDHNEGVAAQLVPNTNCAVFFGITPDITIVDHMGSRPQTYTLKKLNLITNTWDSIQTKNYENLFSKAYSSSVVISNRYIVSAFGTIGNYHNNPSYKDVDIFDLLYQNPNNENISSDNFSLDWVPTISQYKKFSISGTGSNMYASPSTIFFTVLICVVAIIIVIMYTVVNRKIVYFKRKEKCSFQRIINIFYSRRTGETFYTQIYGLAANLILILLLMLFVTYFVYNIINSSVSSTEESFEANDVPFPDVRVCYNGWKYDSYNDTDGDFPYFGCLQTIDPYDINYCKDFYKLPRSILSPKFTEGDTVCYMYAPPKDKLGYIYKNTYFQAHHASESSDSFGQSAHIQLYEPTKNPNRVVFDISPFTHQHSAEYLDAWIDFQLNNSFIHGTAGQIITLDGLPGVNIHFKMTYTQKIDPDSLWNLVGIFPKYIQLSELSITNSEFIGVKKTGLHVEFISIYPLDPKKTVITEKRDVTIMSTLGVLGGIASMLITVRALLFGSRPPKPWGFIQGLSFKSSWEQSKSKNLKKYFRIPGVDNVPFVTPVHQRFSDIYTLNKDHSLLPDSSKSHNKGRGGFLSETSASGTQIESSSIHSGIENDENKESGNSYYNVHERLEQLEARNQILELVLKAYYIDDRIFREIHENSIEEVNTESNLLPEEEKIN